MPYTPHVIQKSKDIVGVAQALVVKRLAAAQVVTHIGFDQFKGKVDDTVTWRLPGRLPARDYPFRNDRSNPLVFDVYKEGKVNLTLSGNAYSAVALIDEQKEFDLNGDFSRLLLAQTDAVATKLNSAARKAIVDAPYVVTIGNARGDIRGALVEANRVLKRFGVPGDRRTLLVGTGWEAAILLDKDLVLAQNVGDATASSALHDATIGRLLGWNVVVDEGLGEDDAYAFVKSGIALATAAPVVPQSVPFGATVSAGGFALRWLQDYDTMYLTDRSVVNAWYGSAPVLDQIYPAEVAPGTPFDPDTLGRYFLRGVKLTLGGTSNYNITAGSDIEKETGIKKSQAWTPRVPVATGP